MRKTIICCAINTAIESNRTNSKILELLEEERVRARNFILFGRQGKTFDAIGESLMLVLVGEKIRDLMSKNQGWYRP